MKRRPSLLVQFTGSFLFLLMPLLTLPVPLSGTTLVWDPTLDQTGTGGTGTWDVATANWLSAGVDAIWSNAGGDTAVFQGMGGLVTLATNITAGGMVFDGPGYSLGGNGSAQVLMLGAGGITVSSSGGPITIGDASLSLQLAGAQSFSNNSTGLLAIAGKVSNGGSLLTLGSISSGGITLSGGLSGAGGLTINSSGEGVVKLSGSNTYTGATSVLAGTLKVGSAIFTRA